MLQDWWLQPYSVPDSDPHFVAGGIGYAPQDEQRIDTILGQVGGRRSWGKGGRSWGKGGRSWGKGRSWGNQADEDVCDDSQDEAAIEFPAVARAPPSSIIPCGGVAQEENKTASPARTMRRDPQTGSHPG